MTKCIVNACQEDAYDSALCRYHGEKLQRAERLALEDAPRRIGVELRQFERLMYEEPPLSVDELAFRMVWPVKDVTWLLRKFKDDRK